MSAKGKKYIIAAAAVLLVLAIGISLIWVCPEYFVRRGMTYGQVTWLMGEDDRVTAPSKRGPRRLRRLHR